MLRVNDTALVVVDVQAKLVPAMHQAERTVDNTRRLAAGAGVLGLPIVWTEQNSRALGPTVAELLDVLPGEKIEKMTFSCAKHAPFMDALAACGRPAILLAGIETHVCIYQTALDLLAAEYEVHVVADAVSSREAENRAIALRKMRHDGAEITTVEMALFELLVTAEHERFRDILRIVK